MSNRNRLIARKLAPVDKRPPRTTRSFFNDQSVPFGKYKGVRFIDMTTKDQLNYLRWFIDNTSADDRYKNLARFVLNKSLATTN